MPKAPRTPEGEAPKKRTRKVAVKAADDTTKVASPAKPVAKKPAAKKPTLVPTPVVVAEVPVATVSEVVAAEAPAVKEVVQMPSIEERIRLRAYELYLRRGGRGGSPEQDWFQAMAEVYGESVA